MPEPLRGFISRLVDKIVVRRIKIYAINTGNNRVVIHNQEHMSIISGSTPLHTTISLAQRRVRRTESKDSSLLRDCNAHPVAIVVYSTSTRSCRICLPGAGPSWCCISCNPICFAEGFWSACNFLLPSLLRIACV